jgi:outer membrane protein assembly factor BamB
MKLRLLPWSAIFLSAALGSGCTLVEHELNGDSHYTKVGKSLATFANVRQVAFHRGRLILSDEDYAHPGIAVIDTSTDTVVEFYKVEKYYPYRTTFAVVRDSLIVVGTENSGARLINLNRKTNTTLPIAMGRLRSSEGRAFRLDTYSSAHVSELASAGAPFSTAFNTGGPLYSLAISNGRIFLGSQNSSKLWIANASTGGSHDSLDLKSFTGDSTTRPYEIVSHEGRIFVHTYRSTPSYNADTNVVLVIRADSLTLEKTIRLGSVHYNEPLGMPNVSEGIWYLTRWSGAGGQGGVEAIDLNARTHLGLTVSSESAGLGVRVFVRTGPVRGYIVYQDDVVAGKVRRVSL